MKKNVLRDSLLLASPILALAVGMWGVKWRAQHRPAKPQPTQATTQPQPPSEAWPMARLGKISVRTLQVNDRTQIAQPRWVLWSPDSQSLAVGTHWHDESAQPWTMGYYWELQVWDVPRASMRWRTPFTPNLTNDRYGVDDTYNESQVQFSPNSALLGSETGSVKWLGQSPDDTSGIVSRQHKGVRLWNARSGQPRTFLSKEGLFRFSADGQRLFTGRSYANSDTPTPELSLREWSLDGRMVRQARALIPAARAQGLSEGQFLTRTLDNLGRDGRWGAYTVESAHDWAGSDAVLFDSRNPQRMQSIQRVVYQKPSRDGRLLALATVRPNASAVQEIQIWDMARGQLQSVCRFGEYAGHEEPIAFSNDGSKLLTASQDLLSDHDNAIKNPQSLCLWDTRDGRLLWTRLETHSIGASDLSPDATLLSAGGQNSTLLIDAPSGRVLSELRGPKSYAWASAFSPDGKMLAVAYQDGTVNLWRIR